MVEVDDGKKEDDEILEPMLPDDDTDETIKPRLKVLTNRNLKCVLLPEDEIPMIWSAEKEMR